MIFGAPDGHAYAIDVKGNVAKKWSSPEPNSELEYARPLANGNLLAQVRLAKSQSGAAGADSVIEVTQDGHVVWKYSDSARLLHHDMERMSNGNTLLVCSKDMDAPQISRKLVTDDCLIEVDPAGKIESVRMQAVSPSTDFSFDFHDLRLTPVAPDAPAWD